MALFACGRIKFRINISSGAILPEHVARIKHEVRHHILASVVGK